ncbi:MAG: glycosyltransferase family 4 protein [Candidatus Marsarchaeota archaeon]|nr:glycosyltransferase family 4 protein [Candidatus Marsarchaeota archaeon]
MKLVMTQSNLTLMGGAERIVLKIAQHYDAPIYTAEFNKETTFPEFKDMNINVISKNKFSKLLPYGRASQGLDYGLSFYGFKMMEDYDVINAHIAPSHWIRNKNPGVLWYCHTPLREVWDMYKYRMSLRKIHHRPIYMAGARAIRVMDRSVVKKIEVILTNSANTRSRVVKYFGREDAEVLNGGVEYERYRDNGDDRYFFYPSRFSPNKRQLYVIDAFKMFKRKKKGYKLILGGAVSNDKYYREYYEKTIEEAKKVGDIQIVANPTDKKQLDLISRATAIMYAPVNEDYGLIPVESMASRKPIISVNEGGPKDTIDNGKTGFLVNNESEMADRMLYVAEHPAISKQMGRRGIATVKKKYTWDRFFEVFDKKLAKTVKIRDEYES